MEFKISTVKDKWKVYEKEKRKLIQLQNEGMIVDYEKQLKEIARKLKI